jgi:hypothetical protein
MDVLAAYRDLELAMRFMPYYSEHMPPHDARLINSGDKIPTAVDSKYGLIDIPQLIKDVKATVDPTYVWSGDLSIHHLYWPQPLYPHEGTDNLFNPAYFRDLPPNKGLVSREFENWTHAVTVPPKPPELDVMRDFSEGWQVGLNLYKIVRNNILASIPGGEDIYANAYFTEIFERNSRALDVEKERNTKVPAEFRLVDTSASTEVISKQIGKLFATRYRNLTRVTTLSALALAS